MGKLVLFHQDGSTKAINLAKERVVIGRRADNDVCLPYPAVSGEHAAVVTILADSFLEDLGSTNGTLVNGAVVQKHFLRDRDQIDIGQQKLVYLADESTQLEDLSINVVRKEIKTFGEKVAKADAARRAQDSASGVAAELDGDVARAEVRNGTEPVEKSSVAPLDEPQASQQGGAGDAPVPDAVETRGDKRARRAPEARRDAAPAAKRKVAGSAGAPDVLDPDPRGARASTDRGLAAMAKLREGDSAHARAQNGGSAVTLADAEHPVPPESPDERVASARITVLSGASAGRSLVIESDEVVIGRVGLQVAAIGRGNDGFRLRLREGDVAPMLNGVAVAAEGAALKSGDIFEVAGARVEFISGA